MATHSLTAPPRRRGTLLLACLLGVALCQTSLADGRGDWPDYAWQKIDIAACQPLQGVLVCPPYHQKWDWKRNQWVDIAITLEPASGRLRLTQQLTNNDSYDDDDVCVTVLVLDATGHNIVAHHQNWHSLHGAVMHDDFAYHSTRLASGRSIQLGSRQCRRGPHQDDAIYAAVLAGLPP